MSRAQYRHYIAPTTMQLCNRSIREHQTQWNVIEYGALLCIGITSIERRDTFGATSTPLPGPPAYLDLCAVVIRSKKSAAMCEAARRARSQD